MYFKKEAKHFLLFSNRLDFYELCGFAIFGKAFFLTDSTTVSHTVSSMVAFVNVGARETKSLSSIQKDQKSK